MVDNVSTMNTQKSQESCAFTRNSWMSCRAFCSKKDASSRKYEARGQRCEVRNSRIIDKHQFDEYFRRPRITSVKSGWLEVRGILHIQNQKSKIQNPCKLQFGVCQLRVRLDPFQLKYLSTVRWQLVHFSRLTIKIERPERSLICKYYRANPFRL